MARSLRHTLLSWLLLPLLAIVPAAAGLQYALMLKPTHEAFDQALFNAAASVASYVRGPGLDDGATANAPVGFDMTAQAERALRTDQFDSIYYAVLGPDGKRIAGDPPLQSPALTLAVDERRVIELELDGTPVRMAALGVACGAAACQVRVGETLNKRQQVLRESLLGTLTGVLAFALASVATIVLATRQALKPLERLGAQLGTRSLDDLRPVAEHGTPAEIHGVVDAVNRLFGRVREGSLAQQAFLADAAHQLRTPLAVLKNETELALAEPHPPHMNAALTRLNTGATRAARLSSQLLALARSDTAAQASIANESLDLKNLASDAAVEWVPRALACGVDLGFELHSAPVQGRQFLLRELLANLIHNALEYAGAGSLVTVRTAVLDGAAVLEVEDNGPGIAAADRDAAFQRFKRGNTAAGAGSGLGLAIVRDIALGHGATVSLHTPPVGRGLLVRVAWSRLTTAQ